MTTSTMLCGDALAILPTLPCGSVVTVITDPPSNSGSRAASERRLQSPMEKYVSGNATSPPRWSTSLVTKTSAGSSPGCR